MTLRIKSNVTSSLASLPANLDVAYSVDDIYNAYATRVTADGGTIVDVQATKDAIAYFKGVGMMSRVGVTASPSWGVKITGGLFDKLYSLFGPDFEGFPIGTGGAKPVAENDAAGNPVATTVISATRVGGLFRTTANLSLADNANDWFAIYTSMSGINALAAQIAFGNLVQSTTGFIPAQLTRSTVLSSSAQRSDYNPAVASDATKRISTPNITNTGVAETAGIATAMRISTGELFLIVDGRKVASVVSSTASLYDYVALSRLLYLGGGYDGSANITASRNAQFREAGVIKRCTLEELYDLTAALSARYL